jgi:hypothetical protein
MTKLGSLTLTLALLLCLEGGASAGPGIFVSEVEPAPQNDIDRAVFSRLKTLGIKPAKLCTDAVFVRRVYLDVIGTLPTAAEARSFIEDHAPTKRALLIDRLLAHDAFADYWALKWGDLLRVKAEFPINLWPNAAKAYHHWIHAALRRNLPYDRFARELLTASGSNFRVPPVNFYRAVQGRSPKALAQAVALTFMGARAERWKPKRLDGMAAFFTHVGSKRTREWKEEIVYFDAIASAKAGPREAVFPDGRRVSLSPDKDPRRVFAAWLIQPKNPWFTRSIANRVWSWLLGRGAVHPVDDLRADNPPWNPALLAALEKKLVASRYDLRALYRFVLLSHTYQLAPVPRSGSIAVEAEFACYRIRRLQAEVLIDALCQVTGTSEQYSSVIPEPFTIVPQGTRATTLPDGSITSSFLELFGRPSRDTGKESERNNRVSAAQRLHLLNSSHVRGKILKSKKLRKILRGARRDPRGAVQELYLTILSRFPTDEELLVLRDYAQGAETKRFVLVDLTWALINSSEFLYRH